MGVVTIASNGCDVGGAVLVGVAVLGAGRTRHSVKLCQILGTGPFQFQSISVCVAALVASKQIPVCSPRALFYHRG